jgi:hypothetical protein
MNTNLLSNPVMDEAQVEDHQCKGGHPRPPRHQYPSNSNERAALSAPAELNSTALIARQAGRLPRSTPPASHSPKYSHNRPTIPANVTLSAHPPKV